MGGLLDTEWYRQPLENARVWRYMTFSKYVRLISTRELHFTRADCLKDPFEGARGAGPLPEHYRPSRSSLYNSNAIRLRSFVNCWHQEHFEVMAMWHMYGNPEESVAIMSTFGRLRRALPPGVMIGSVNYINYRHPPAWFKDGIETMFCKHRAFGFEHELRALIESSRRPRGGLDLRTDLSQLIKNVYLAPASPDWFQSAVASATNQYGLRRDLVRRSALDKAPIYNNR
jgi:hypothetical protein